MKRRNIYGELEHSAARSMCLAFPMCDGRYLAQVVVPRNITEQDAKRLCTFVMTLVIPREPHEAP